MKNNDDSFSSFSSLATNSLLTKYQKIDFPNSYREGYENLIFDDIRKKLFNLNELHQLILDIGPGCTDLPRLLINLSEQRGHTLNLIDSHEMLSLLPDSAAVNKISAKFPNCEAFLRENRGKINVILCYSVFQYILLEKNVEDILDILISLLAPGGQLLIGDIPNASKKARFLQSSAGVSFINTNHSSDVDAPIVSRIKFKHIDDDIIFRILSFSRSRNMESYLLGQDPTLPMHSRREDVLVVAPY